ncbi:MAG: monooxygenase [Hyphomonadaceae bacterium]|nr:monooxygenase [Hyphomonadaceae bacterium]MAV50857.1 monooxygenase [Hyphomonadaceae bacterium]OUX93362.1 MAG: monooxygenase [Hyphomonas sp. TMED17]OUX94094.1 MAG: monooxygenase [Hyphomonas sp. TMED17]CAI8334047.1 MAG: Putative monooxygenase [Hyphomonas sp. TMED17]
MKSPICDMLGNEFPLLAFTHCRDVVVAVSKAGGMGVFGAVNLPPDRLKEELDWIVDHIDGKPFGVDLIVPNKFEGKADEFDGAKLLNAVPQAHKDYASKVMGDYGIDEVDLEGARSNSINFAKNLRDDGAASAMEVAFQYPIKIIVNALGVPPQSMLDMAKKHGVATGALVGAKEHAVNQVNAGVDVLIVAGGEAGGHCGDVSTMVLIPEVARAVRDMGASTPILAAGGITTGEQMAASMAMGAAGAWCGSVWLTTSEAETNPVVKEKMIEASSRDTVRSRARTGKHSRQLRSPWTDAWESEDAPEALPMPLQSLVSEPALKHIDKLSQGGHEGAKALATYWVGQGVGLMNQSMSAGQVVQQFKEEYIQAYEQLMATMDI